jgi:Flp pilus assembly protein TadD
MSNPREASRVDAVLDRAARDARASGNTAEAAVLLERIYQRNPKDAAIATGFAQALREDEQFTRARQVILPYAQGAEPYPDAVIELAMIQLSLGQYKEAELTARKATKLDPESGRAYLALGTALDAQNGHEEAETAFRKGIDQWNGDPAPIMNNLALNLAAQNKLEQAIDMLNKAKEISPGRMELERNLRIITTLQEGADDFLIKREKKQEAAKVEADKPKAEAIKPEAKKPEAKKLEPSEVKQKQAPAKPVAAKKIEPKPAASKPVKAEIEKESEQDKNTNRRGSTQGFNVN